MKHNSLRNVTMFFALFILFAPFIISSNAHCLEDYSLQYEVITNSSEAEVIVRHGDIDNMGFGWPDGFDLFSGESTPAHYYPWTVNQDDAVGTDRIMVVSSYGVMPNPCGLDGYTANTSRPDNSPQTIQIAMPSLNNPIKKILLQIFVDDFQASVLCGKYEVLINNIPVPELEQIINSLNQTGPIGKLITFQFPDYILASLQNSRSISILIDDTTTGAGDGFAFDFFRLLINPKGEYQKSGTITGSVYDAKTGKAISNAKVSVNEMLDTTTDSDGYFELSDVPAGMAGITASATGYESKTETVELVMDDIASIDFYLLEKEQSDVCDLTDSDGDGVIDTWDHCLDTPANSYVDRYGCPAKVDDKPPVSSDCELSTLSQDLMLNVPIIKYDVPLLDTIYIWADLKFTPTNDNKIFFELKDYGIIKND
ncbi:MAG: carboxypeptidase regulatory-like domain-containing protein [Desulfamplus sp.]|nr:carboxypeptidase regulatory-like domain-containing protein [Desulfamplus sp.]